MTTDDFTLHPRLRAALHDLFGLTDEHLRPGADLERDLQLDSLSIVELQVVMEEALDLRVMEPHGTEVTTLADLQALLEQSIDAARALMPTLRLSESP